MSQSALSDLLTGLSNLIANHAALATSDAPVAATVRTHTVRSQEGTEVTFTELPGGEGARVSIPGVGHLTLSADAVIGLRDALVAATS